MEQEEEFLTNTLQRQLAVVQAEKELLEAKLAAEHDYVATRLKPQVC